MSNEIDELKDKMKSFFSFGKKNKTKENSDEEKTRKEFEDDTPTGFPINEEDASIDRFLNPWSIVGCVTAGAVIFIVGYGVGNTAGKNEAITSFKPETRVVEKTVYVDRPNKPCEVNTSTGLINLVSGAEPGAESTTFKILSMNNVQIEKDESSGYWYVMIPEKQINSFVQPYYTKDHKLKVTFSAGEYVQSKKGITYE